MLLQTIYDKQEDIPEGYGDLYTEKNGKWELTGIKGIKTQGDVDRVTSALTKERADHKVTKTALAVFEGLDPEVVRAQATELEETKAQLAAIKKDGTIDDTKLEPIIEARVRQRIAPVERDKTALERKLQEQAKLTEAALGEVGSLKGTITTGTIERAIRDAAGESKMHLAAVTDAVMHGRNIFEFTEDNRIITKDGIPDVTPGLSPKEWVNDQKEKAPHWWPVSQGGNARGGTGTGPGALTGKGNPWTAAGWNITEQGRYVTLHGEAKARAACEAAGSTWGATKAPVKEAA